jgi:site-specific DNA recombinase
VQWKQGFLDSLLCTTTDDILKKVTAKRFIKIFTKEEPIDQFEVDLYFKLVEKITVYDEGILIVSLLDGSEVECRIE